MKKHTLKAQKRAELGRKVKALRAKGFVPATVYGKKLASESVAVTAVDFTKVYSEAGETGLVELTVDGSTSPVLIHSVQKNPLTRNVLHVEFYHVDLKEKVHTKVPLHIVGEAAAVTEKKGVLMTLLSEVEVEALPAELPENIEVDVAALADVDQEIKVEDLKAPSGVTVLTDGAIGVVKIAALVTREAEEQAQEEAAAAESATAENVSEATDAASGEKAPEAKTEDAPKDK